MLPILLLLSLVVSSSAFSLPFKVHAAVTNITKGGQTLEEAGIYFVANLTVGTPGQLFTVVIDTTTSDLLIPDVSCTSDSCAGKRKFDSSLSQTYYKFGQTSSVTNALGTFNGFVAADWLVLGDRKTDLITIPSIKFLLTTKLGDNLRNINADGILGLAFTSDSSIGANSPFVQGVRQGDISDSFFSIWLEHYGQTMDSGTHGVIYYGGLDPVHCMPDAQYFPLQEEKLFQAMVFGFSSAGKSATNSNDNKVPSYITTVNNYITAPAKYLSAIFDSIGENYNAISRWPATVDCYTKITLTFKFQGGTTVTVTERDLVQSYKFQCILMVMPGKDNGIIELGLPFLRGRCTYFDVVANRIGVATAKLQD